MLSFSCLGKLSNLWIVRKHVIIHITLQILVCLLRYSKTTVHHLPILCLPCASIYRVTPFFFEIIDLNLKLSLLYFHLPLTYIYRAFLPSSRGTKWERNIYSQKWLVNIYVWALGNGHLPQILPVHLSAVSIFNIFK